VKTGVQRYLNLLEITGFRLEFTPYLIRGRNDKNAIHKTFARASLIMPFKGVIFYA
jgi:hypothetical protein